MCRTSADAALIEAAQRIAPLVRACRDEGECERRLPAQVLAAMHEARLFRMYIPKALDGPEIDPIKSMIVVEEIAREIVKGGPDECRTQSQDHPGEGQMGLGQVPLSRVRNGTPA